VCFAKVDLLNLLLQLAELPHPLFIWSTFMSQLTSNMVRALVLRELEAGKRDDGLWVQAMSESNMDAAKAQVRYVVLRTQAMQNDVQELLIKQIRGAVAKDSGTSGVRLSNASLADYLSAKTTSLGNK
jgi:hypothetical protein